MALPSHSNLIHEGQKQINQEHEEDDQSFLSAMQLITSIVVPMALQSAFELGVFEAIAGAGEGARLSVTDIAIVIALKNNPEALAMLDRVLRLLASHCVLHCSVVESEERVYSLSPVSKYFVKDHHGVSFGPILTMIHDKVFTECWGELKGAIREGGIAFNRVYGMHAFEYARLDTRFNDVFNKAMHNSTTLIMNKILQSYNGFEQFKTVVDVGGGLGVNLHLITSKYPHVHGINFDLPHVIQHAPNYPGVQHMGGDMFECVPRGDVIFMKWILHDWSDEQCVKVLKNCYKAIGEKGKVIIVEGVIPTEPEMYNSIVAKTILQADMLMMIQNSRGRERTHQQFLHLATSSGFSTITFMSHVCGQWVIEFCK